MSNRVTIKLTANFERNLADIEQFLIEAEAPQAFDGLLDELLGRVLPNLERFPELGRPFFNRAIGSAEAVNATAELKAKLAALVGTSLTSLREYVMNHYLVLYVQVDDTLFLLSIKHHKQLSFDFEGHWGSSACQTQAVFRCVACGHQAHADVVGAINILARGHRAAACGEVVSRARPETERSKAKRAASAKQEPTEATTAGSACCGAVGIPRL